jgi:polar amino acid transport system substrate-binding protein
VPRLRSLLAVLVLPAIVAVAACGSSSGGSSSSTASGSQTTAANPCAKANLDLYKSGQLTVATDKPAFPPYFVNDDPTNGKGFESAVAYGIARRLGFTPAQVKWTVEPFNSSYAPGPKKFDFDVNQISITPARAKVVDFSRPYYTAPQAIVAKKGSQPAAATSLAALKDSTLGVQVGTTSLDAVQQVIKPSKDPKVFNDSNDVVTALKQGAVDAVVVDLPTAFFLTAAQVPGAKIVGQFSAPGGDTWGALMKKGSSLTACVNQALARMRSSGELAQLTKRWMGAASGAPTLG